MLTQTEIAKALGLSFRTVSRCLNNKGYVSPESRKMIEDYAQKKGYRPNLLARSLVLKKSNIIGLLVPSIAYSYYPEITENIQHTLRKYGYNLLLAVSNENCKEEKNEIETFLSLPVDGIIFCPTSFPASRENCKLLLKNKIPFVLFDKIFPDIPCSYVTSDNADASKKIVEHLLGLGHSKIAHIAGPRGDSFSIGLLEGYKAALKSAKIPFSPDLVYYGSITEKHGYDSMNDILSLKDRPTAVQAVNDIVAIGAVQAAKRKGIKIPDDMSLTGFSDLRISGLLTPSITTVREQVDRLGVEASEIIIGLIDKSLKKNKKLMLKGKLILRESSGKIR